MAVYTDVAAEDLARFLAGYDVGELLSYKGIAEGVENSNFLLHTDAGEFILTLYEKRVEASDERLAAARERLELPEIATDAAALQVALAELDVAQHENDQLYARWAELTEKAG